MTKRAGGILSVAVLTLALAGIASPAAAGNGHGNGNGNGNAGRTSAPEPASAPGNSANAPGQNKDTQLPSQSEPSPQSGAPAPSSGNRDKQKGGGNQNSASQPGVKPANNTAKNTSCVTGGSGSSVTCPSTGPTSGPASGKADASKRYGNGRTAAQIAAQNGAEPGTKLNGPGNSQPHKVVTCRHPHGVDIHALKSHPAGTPCAAQVPPEKSVTPPTSCLCGDSPHDPGAPATAGSNASPSPDNSRGNDVADVSTAGTGGLKSVLGTIAVVGHGELPFTGFPLWAAVGIGLVLIALGLALRGPVPGHVKRGLEDRSGSGPR